MPSYRVLIALFGLVMLPRAHGEEALVAVAASFLPPMQALVEQFEPTSGHVVKLVSGSTGALYAQIVNGAPFDVFIAADTERPQRLEASGHGLAGTRGTVALGRLVLIGSDTSRIGELGLLALEGPALRHVALANPRVAPYGVAAQQTLEALGLWANMQPLLVRGESVAQTYAMVASGNADVGFVALAQVLASGRDDAYALVPQALYEPIRQDVIVLARSRDNPAARGIRDYLFSAPAQAVIRRFGYATEGT